MDTLRNRGQRWNIQINQTVASHCVVKAITHSVASSTPADNLLCQHFSQLTSGGYVISGYKIKVLIDNSIMNGFQLMMNLLLTVYAYFLYKFKSLNRSRVVNISLKT